MHGNGCRRPRSRRRNVGGADPDDLALVLSLPAGNYSYYFACRGGGEVTFGISSGAGVGAGATGTAESPVLSGPCTGQVQGGDFTAVEGGTEFRIKATGDPIDFVIRYGDPIAR